MARFHGKIGYGESLENPPGSGVWIDDITEYPYYGDLVKVSRSLEGDDKLNRDILTGNSISIVADQYAMEHFFNIRYVEWANARWEIVNVDVQPPRLVLRLGNLYNGPIPE